MRDVLIFVSLMLMAGLGFEIGRYVTIKQIRTAIRNLTDKMISMQGGNTHDTENLHANGEGK